jgi:hydroxypyruvate isomerase
MDILDERGRSLLSRRSLIRLAAFGPLLLEAESLTSSTTLSKPKFTLSVNIEMMFPREMPRGERIRRIADHGMKAFSFWTVSEEDERMMLAAQKQTGLKCGSIAGAGKIGWTTGLTRTGAEKAYFDVITQNCKVANRFGAKNLVIFVGELQKDIPWDTQYRQIVSGLKQAGDIAAKHDVYLCLEPLNRVESPQMTMLLTEDASKIITDVSHPRVKMDYDLYHRQLGEGNLINQLKRGLDKGHIQFVEVGDVPGRKEPGTGEVNYPAVFRILREAGYSGFVGMEHGTSSTPEHAMQVVSELASKS